ncbi:MAG: lysine--tRNA ligase [bacterium]|nr:lysine--tRNA ligase [bacterium]
MDTKKIDETRHWADVIADKVIEKFPNEKIYTCAAGISPSGVVHFGNFRDVITSFAVAKKLKEKGKNVRFIFSWDDFDRLRKVPAGLNETFAEHIGKALSMVPSPEEGFYSYAEKFEKEFEKSMQELGIELEYKYQTKEYASGRYDEQIIHALKNREKIADVLLSFMTEKGKEDKNINPEEYKQNYYPVSVYSKFTGKDNTKVLEYDGGTNITYKCFDSGNTETIDFTKDRIVKLSWKVDWPMRWKIENVNFEPAGHDHASPGSSFDVSSVIAKEVFNILPPVFQEYNFVGIQGLGTKMSGSKGNAISPQTLLEIYTPELLKWIYLQKLPTQTFSIAFNSEIYKQYSEFDANLEMLKNNTLENWQKDSMALSDTKIDSSLPPIPFRQAVSFGQIIQWDKNKLTQVLESMDLHYNLESITVRTEKARAWLETYNKEEIIKLLEEKNTEYIKTLTSEKLEQVKKLRQELISNNNGSIKELDTLVYSIPKDSNLSDQENAPLQRSFFKDVYNLLIGKDTGPRLSTFLWAADREQILELLEI